MRVQGSLMTDDVHRDVKYFEDGLERRLVASF